MSTLTDIRLGQAQVAFNKVRNELCELGLLADGEYLDEIGLVISAIPSLGEAGYVYDRGVPLHKRLMGYQPGIIYLPRNVPHTLYAPGETLVDVVRHEFGHAWAWLDREYIEGEWFARAFGNSYFEMNRFENSVYQLLNTMQHPITGTPVWGWHFEHYGFAKDFFSPYAMKAVYEDFAETFMCFLRYRRSLQRFKNRPGLYRKLKAVESAVHKKAKTLHL